MINETDVIWDETPQQEQAIVQPEEAVTPVVDVQAEVPQQEAIVWDEPIIEQPQQIDPIEQHRPPEVDDNTWMDIKNRVGKFITDYSPVMAVPQMVTGLAGEVAQKEGSQVAEAMSVKSRLENIDFAYKDLADTVKSATGDKEAEATLKTKQNRLNDEVVGILEDRGIEAFNDNGKLMVVTKDKDGNEILNDLDDEVLDSVLGGFTASAGEIGGAVIGATGGAVQAQRFLPPVAPPQARATAGLIGAGIGGYTGAAAGRATDLIRNAISLNKEIDAKEVLQKSLEAGTADVVGTAAVGAIAKGASKAVEPLGKASQRLKTLFKEGNIEGAKRVVKEDYGLTDDNIDTLYNQVAKDVEGVEDLTGDDLLRAKLTAVIQQQPQGKPLITKAISDNAKAAIETSKEIDSRAKEVMNAAQRFSKKPSAIKKSVAAYEKAVAKNYGEVRGLIDEALPNYKYSFKGNDFDKTLKDLETRVIDPLVKDKMTNLINVVSQKMDGGVADLIDLRQMVNKFYGKNQSAFELKPDKEALFNIQKTIDNKLDEAINSVDGATVSTALSKAFKDAKAKYAEMFKTQDTATYNAIFRKGASEDDIGKALVKYSKSADQDLESVLSKLSPVQRTKSEFSIIKQMVDQATAKGEAKAIDFTKLLDDIGTSKNIFKTDEAKQFLKNIESYDKKFGKDVDIQKIAAGVAPKVEKNIATSMAGKILMKISALRFEALQRMMPTEQGRRLSLQKSIESALEKSRTPREFFFEASKIKGMPNKDRTALKKAIKEIGEKEQLLKAEQVKQEAKNKASIDKAIKDKEDKAKRDLIKMQAEDKKKTDAAKARWEKKKSEQKKLNEQAQKAKDSATYKIGQTEEDFEKEQKNVFAKNKTDEAKYKGMSKEDIAEQDRLDLEDEANRVFAKGAPELLGGAVAGIEQDEQGNITLDPQKFLIGVLGVSSIKGLAKAYKKSPKTQAKVEKALKDLASDSARVAGDMIEKINKQIGLNIEPRIVADTKAVKEVDEAIDKTTRDANFKKWFKDSKVVDENDDPLVVYHGTTHDFAEFTMDRANPENHHGTGFYFSDSIEDVNRNYGTETGADLTQRIDMRAEQLANELDLEYDDPKVIEMAKKELSGETPNVMPVYVSLKKPAVVGGDNQEWLELRRYDDEGEWLDEPEGDGAELFDSLIEAIENNAYDSGNAYQIVGEVQEEIGEEFTLEQFEQALRRNEEFGYLEDDMGRLINHEIIGDTYSNAGYDGIILHNAEEQFPNMGMSEGTKHYVVFKPNNIKSVNNSGAFSKDGNILKGAITIPIVGIASQQEDRNVLSKKKSN